MAVHLGFAAIMEGQLESVLDSKVGLMTYSNEVDAALSAIRLFANRQLQTSLSDPDHQKRSSLPRSSVSSLSDLYDEPRFLSFSIKVSGARLRADIMASRIVQMGVFQGGQFWLKNFDLKQFTDDEVTVRKVKLQVNLDAAAASVADAEWAFYTPRPPTVDIAAPELSFKDMQGEFNTKCWGLLRKHAGKKLEHPDLAIPCLESRFAAALLACCQIGSPRCVLLMLKMTSLEGARVMLPMRSSANVWYPNLALLDFESEGVHLTAHHCAMEVAVVPDLLGLRELQALESTETIQLRREIATRLLKNKRKRIQLKEMFADLGTQPQSRSTLQLADISEESD